MLFEPKCTQQAKSRVRDWRVRLCQANSSQHGDRKVRTGREAAVQEVSPMGTRQNLWLACRRLTPFTRSQSGKGRFLKVYGTEIWIYAGVDFKGRYWLSEWQQAWWEQRKASQLQGAEQEWVTGAGSGDNSTALSDTSWVTAEIQACQRALLHPDIYALAVL